MLGPQMGAEMVLSGKAARTEGALPADGVRELVAAQPLLRLEQLVTGGAGQRCLGQVNLFIIIKKKISGE